MEEIWKAIAGYGGGYEVSSIGRVRSIARTVQTKSGVREYRSVLRKQSEGSHGYLVVSLSSVGKITTECVHRLVLETFVGACPDGMEVCHGKAGRLDNSVENLRWDTRAENIRDQIRHGTKRTGATIGKWLEEQIRDVKRKLASGLGQTEIERMTGIPKETVHAVKKERIWRWVNV